jgi:hypothetical protein
MPVPEPTDATAELLLLHVPPPASVSALVEPAQTLIVPVMEEGSGLTVIIEVT